MILIYSREKTERLAYTCNLLFDELLSEPCLITSDREDFELSDLPKINYSEERFINGLFLKPHPLLFETDIHQQNLSPIEFGSMRLFFESSPDSILPFDPLAFCFYLVSRYEEYLPFVPDEHQRFPASESILYKNSLWKKPVVQIVARQLATEIQKKYPEFGRQQPAYSFQMTIDIDNAWAYRHKGFWRTTGALAKSVISGNSENTRERVLCLSGVKKDPYDTYGYIEETWAKHTGPLHFFILTGNRHRYDKSVPYRHPVFRRLIQRLASKYPVGIHPSYASNDHPRLLPEEISRLADILGKPVTQSRQHFLKLRFPETYRRLIHCGITDDFSMGYSDQIGFRAGTSSPFRFFDLEANQTTNLTIHPFQVMDVTLKNKLLLSPDEAIDEITTLINAVKAIGGTFTALWHNESLGDTGEWKNWQSVFEQTCNTGMQNGTES